MSEAAKKALKQLRENKARGHRPKWRIWKDDEETAKKLQAEGKRPV